MAFAIARPPEPAFQRGEFSPYQKWQTPERSQPQAAIRTQKSQAYLNMAHARITELLPARQPTKDWTVPHPYGGDRTPMKSGGGASRGVRLRMLTAESKGANGPSNRPLQAKHLSTSGHRCS
jgi:hypothetical protein